MLDQIGGWPAHFFFGHEETNMAWRALDAGWEILYQPDIVLQHPKTSPARHAVYYRNNARNRVWLARRRLPAPTAPGNTNPGRRYGLPLDRYALHISAAARNVCLVVRLAVDRG